jgi:hypothetical protein
MTPRKTSNGPVSVQPRAMATCAGGFTRGETRLAPCRGLRKPSPITNSRAGSSEVRSDQVHPRLTGAERRGYLTTLYDSIAVAGYLARLVLAEKLVFVFPHPRTVRKSCFEFRFKHPYYFVGQFDNFLPVVFRFAHCDSPLVASVGCSVHAAIERFLGNDRQFEIYSSRSIRHLPSSPPCTQDPSKMSSFEILCKVAVPFTA